MDRTITFTLKELRALAGFIAGLNENGVPFNLTKEDGCVTIYVSEGY